MFFSLELILLKSLSSKIVPVYFKFLNFQNIAEIIEYVETTKSMATLLSNLMITELEKNSTKHPEFIDLYDLVNSGPEIGKTIHHTNVFSRNEEIWKILLLEFKDL